MNVGPWADLAIATEATDTSEGRIRKGDIELGEFGNDSSELFGTETA